MRMNDYQNKANETAIFNVDCEIILQDYKTLENTNVDWIYPALGLADESGEVLGKLKKVIRDNKGIISKDIIESVKKELGDVLWYLAVLSKRLNLNLEDVATANLEKLSKRKENGTLRGSGDDR